MLKDTKPLLAALGATATVAWRLARVRDRRKMSGLPVAVGNEVAQKRFTASHKAFLREFSELQQELETVLTESQKKISEKPTKDNPRTDEENAAAIVFSLERAACVDFGELLLLAANGLGLGATKALRSIYEYLVTAMYIAHKPSEAKPFLDQGPIEEGKVLNRYKQVVPERLAEDFTPEQLGEAQERFAEAKAQRKEEICTKCGQPKTQEAWTRVSLDTMAQEVSKELYNAYTTCYLNPTLLAHATPSGLNMRVRISENGFDYKHLSEPEAHGAVMRGHWLMLGVLGHLNEYFKIGRNDEFKNRFDAFDPIWAKENKS